MVEHTYMSAKLIYQMGAVLTGENSEVDLFLLLLLNDQLVSCSVLTQ